MQSGVRYRLRMMLIESNVQLAQLEEILAVFDKHYPSEKPYFDKYVAWRTEQVQAGKQI